MLKLWCGVKGAYIPFLDGPEGYGCPQSIQIEGVVVWD